MCEDGVVGGVPLMSGTGSGKRGGWRVVQEPPRHVAGWEGGVVGRTPLMSGTGSRYARWRAHG